MEVEYELTREDLFAFQWRAAFTSPRGRRIRLKTYLYLLLAIVLLSIVPAIGPDGFVISRVSFTFLFIAYPTVALAQWFLERRLMRRALLRLVDEEKPGRGQLGKHRVVVTQDGVVESTAVGESRTSWAGVNRVDQDPDYIYIYTSAAAAHVVPKRAFSDREAAEAFFQLVRGGKEAAA
jgi:YcxB-like protein